MNKIAFITGCSGQDGSYLAEFLLNHGYIVHGLIRHPSSLLDKLCKDSLFLHYGDMTDGTCLNKLISKIQPTEVYNLAGISDVKLSFDTPENTSNVIAMGTLKLLEACKSLNKPIRFYQASTSQMFGETLHIQTEYTPFACNSPYSVSKLFAHEMCVHYRRTYGMYITCGILFNHTSPRRADTFVEKKIVTSAFAIAYGKQKCVYFGNLYSERDIGHAKDYVRAMWLMMIQDTPDDYVIATGKSTSIKSIIDYVFKKVGLTLTWSGTGLDEVGCNQGRKLVLIDKENFRPTDVSKLIGCSQQAHDQLGWKPKYTLEMTLDEMIECERKKYETGDGYKIKKFEPSNDLDNILS